METMDKRKVIERVQKLLSLATSDNENEAKAATAQANKLLTKYNLSMQEVSKRDYEESDVTTKTKASSEDKWVLPILRDFFFVYPLIVYKNAGYSHTGRRRTTVVIRFIGDSTNVEAARYVYEFLSREYQSLWKKYKAIARCTTASKESYYHGLTWGLKEQLKVSQVSAQQETGLVLVNDPGLKKFVNDMHPDAKAQTQKVNTHDRQAQSQGIQDGKKINISKRLDGNSSSDETLRLGR